MNHVIGGNAVVPTVFATAWMIAIAQHKLGIAGNSADFFQQLELSNYRLFKGINLGGSTAPATELTLYENCEILNDGVNTSESASPSQALIKLFSLNEQARPVFHYQVQVGFNTIPAPPAYTDFNIKADSSQISGQEVYAEILFHTGAFRGIQTLLNHSPTHLTLLCRIDNSQHKSLAQLPTNPLADDLVLQALCIHPNITLGCPALPTRFSAWHYYQATPLDTDFYISLKVVKSNKMQLVANIAVHDENGNLYSYIEQGVSTMSENLKEAFKQNKLLH